jgi:hypothetical protein
MSDHDGLTGDFALVPFPFLTHQGPASLRSCAGIVPTRYHPQPRRCHRPCESVGRELLLGTPARPAHFQWREGLPPSGTATTVHMIPVPAACEG